MTRHIHDLIARLKASNTPVPEDLLVTLADAAREVCEADVVVSHAEWVEFFPEERAALAAARRSEHARRLALLVVGLGGPGAAAVAADHDGGEAATREALEAAHREAWGTPFRG